MYRKVYICSLSSETETERLSEYFLYGGDDPADDLVGGDDLAVLAGAGPRDPATTGPGPTSNLCSVKTDGCSVLTSARHWALTLSTGRDTKLSSRVLSNLLWREGSPTGTGTEVGHSTSSSAGVAVVVKGELELLAVRAQTGLG